MAIAADTPARGDGIQRGRGGFLRNAADVPYVTDPSGATVKSGARKGEPKRLAYGSPSNRAKQIENSTNLVKWGERRVVLGIGADPGLVEMCAQLVALDVDSDEYKTLADSIIIRAKDAAEANLAAEVGTHVHALTEDHDTERDWVQRAAAGEVLGVPAEVQRQAVEAWAAFLADRGLEVLAVEASVVDDTWRLAGTLDRILRTTVPLRFARVTGEVVEVPAGVVVVGDVKTSKKRLGRDGVVGWWQAYAIQIASYAQSVPYDTEAETRGVWPWEIDQTHALILRPNVVEVLAGEAERVEWELIHVDLVAGREHGGQCVVDAKAWEARKDIFSVAQLPTDVAPATLAPAPPRAAPDAPPSGHRAAHVAGATTIAAEGAPPPPSAAPNPAVAAAPTGAQQGATVPVTPAPPVADLSPLRQAQADRARQVAEAEARRRLLPHDTPEEGTVSDEPTFLALRQRYDRLPAAQKAWIKLLGEQAEAAKVGFSARTTKTARRYEILRALVVLAEDDQDDTAVRDLLALVDQRIEQLGTIPLGHIVGSLTATEAATFAALATGALAATFTDDGTPLLSPAHDPAA